MCVFRTVLFLFTYALNTTKLFISVKLCSQNFLLRKFGTLNIVFFLYFHLFPPSFRLPHTATKINECLNVFECFIPCFEISKRRYKMFPVFCRQCGLYNIQIKWVTTSTHWLFPPHWSLFTASSPGYLLVPGLRDGEGSTRSSISEMSGISGASTRTYINEASTLVLETVENGVKK